MQIKAKKMYKVKKNIAEKLVRGGRDLSKLSAVQKHSE